MISVNDLRKAYAEKLMATDSHDAAFTKAVWMAYQAGWNDALAKKEPCTEQGEALEDVR